ncbi:MAG: hypothetical protein GXY76_18845 [Chloroflexi bacterium]|nr:hypothetical protein [Chloroflexota bacterium]
MRFAVGYQMAEEGEEPFSALLSDYREHIAEVYFPWMGMASGRSPLSVRRGYANWTAQEQLEDDLRAFRAMGMELDLLFNANCYGGRAISLHLQNEIASILEHLQAVVGGVDIITTTSPAVAHMVKEHFPEVRVRASVNMRIGTIKGMQYVADLFDAFHVQREHNRDLDYLRELKAWADEHGKTLTMLANSGCMNHCSGQSFHDNLVAHEAEIAETRNIEGWIPHACWRYLRDPANWPSILQNSWVRPEDLHHYEGIFSVVKLATRMHQRPRMVLEAYTKRRYHGNLLDLMEPGYSPALAPRIMNNDAFPEEWFERTSRCDRRCYRCDYCARVLEQVLTAPEAF